MAPGQTCGTGCVACPRMEYGWHGLRGLAARGETCGTGCVACPRMEYGWHGLRGLSAHGVRLARTAWPGRAGCC